jgi:hypothetical protein
MLIEQFKTVYYSAGLTCFTFPRNKQNKTRYIRRKSEASTCNTTALNRSLLRRCIWWFLLTPIFHVTEWPFRNTFIWKKIEKDFTPLFLSRGYLWDTNLTVIRFKTQTAVWIIVLPIWHLHDVCCFPQSREFIFAYVKELYWEFK